MRYIITLYFAGIFMACIPIAQAQNSSLCERACLEDIADQYLAAMVAHDASQAPLAGDLIFTENTIRLPPTEGLWFTASGLGNYKFYITDSQEGQVAWTGIAMEHDKPVLLSVRLKVVNRRITEAESIVVRDVNEERNLANLKALPPGFTDTLAPSERMSREEMLRMPDIYFEALDTLDASGIPWDKDSYRIENGMVTCGTIPDMAPPAPGMPASRSCISPDGKVPPMLKTIYSVHPRRTPVVDEERGLSWGLYCFNHRGLATIKMPDGSIQPSYSTTPNSMPFADMFKTKNGKLRGIFAFGTRLPYGIGDGWSGPEFK
ncbi:MAG: hypothetical protein A3I78_00045 [Gammaproteobacteria bacterium RIFCSPLOWO2_02_FULL_56_15]|nr:MAG: hypothetical protein A3I78_00045 [Gammaproteobacteria bacterium RIFCSPLOWO2_02_FULL_56_15]